MSSEPAIRETRTPSDERVRRRWRFAAVLGAFGLLFVGVAAVVGSPAPLAFSVVLIGVGAVLAVLAVVDGRYAAVETVVDDDGVRVHRTTGADLDLAPGEIRSVEAVDDAYAEADPGIVPRFGRRAFLTGARSDRTPGVRIGTSGGDVVIASRRTEELVAAIEAIDGQRADE